MEYPRVHIVPDKKSTARSSTDNELIFEDETLCIERHTIHACCVPLHYHDGYELEIVLSGEAQNALMSHTLQFDRAALVLMSPAEVHRLSCNERCEVLSVKFSATGSCEKYMRSLQFPFCTHLSEGQFAQLEAHLRLLSQELSEASAELTGFLAHNFAEWLIPYVVCDATVEPVPNTHTHARMMEGLEYVRSRFRQGLTLSEVARVCGYSPNYFGLRFRELTGMSFREYVCAERLNYACHLLSQSGMSIGDISAECGFESTAYFSRCFLQMYGQTPSEYRKNR